MMRTLLSHILQRTTGPLKTGPLAASTAQELDQSFEIILRKACAGQITLSQAQELASLIDVRRRVIDTREHEARLEAVEQVLKDGKDGTDKCGN
jgi:hypothetical protein